MILSRFHYVPNVEQTPQALLGIALSFIWLPALGYALAILPVLFYHRFEREEQSVREQLTQRRALAASLSASS